MKIYIFIVYYINNNNKQWSTYVEVCTMHLIVMISLALLAWTSSQFCVQASKNYATVCTYLKKADTLTKHEVNTLCSKIHVI